MAATTAGALKAWIEAGGLGVAVYRERAPENAAYPHVVIHEAISILRDADGDGGDPNADRSVAETVQVSLWQLRASESYGLRDALIRRLDGARLPAAPTLVYAVTVGSAARVPDEDPALLHDAVTCTVHRRL